MVTVREQLPGRLNELSQEATVEHAEQAQHDLAEWLDRVRSILDDAKLEQLEEVANLTLQKELETTLIIVPIPFIPVLKWRIFWPIYMSMKTPWLLRCSIVVYAKA